MQKAHKVWTSSFLSLVRLLDFYLSFLLNIYCQIGVVYCKKGQLTEVEMLSNSERDTSTEYREFLKFLGARVELNEAFDK